MPTLAIVGAGPGMGLAIARTFGRRGFDVALVARTKEQLDALADQLGREGVAGRGQGPRRRHRRTGVLAGPAVPAVPGFTSAAPSEVAVDNLQPQIEYSFYGAVTAAQAVLPAMREAGTGTLLFTTGGGSVDPVPMLGNINAAQATLRNWVINLNEELDGSGVYAGHVAIGVWVGGGAVGGAPVGFPTATPEQIAPLHWDLHENRDRPEAVFAA
ncbi:MAG TPA: SDR family NAD(P)-dependent oxidoreductase [Pseudonocardia sp.]|uniref:SDR family NAD(P)-dependent oxidoreductase n=1 Tax=Pseudonocardia sp. TaxID=60912 RepID=UPI002B4AC18C|nr:SDR family NAD(P)-dependent oxidoreductase [Pseudonocardia sp.]HLU55889.1 SDR family NAD(P)-dependent oxidoreductase [Pseudonocardia sp.]